MELVPWQGRWQNERVDYIDLLSVNLLPYMQSMGPEFIFMDDNAPYHWARAVLQWMSNNSLRHMEVCPPQSPDLNPVEHGIF